MFVDTAIMKKLNYIAILVLGVIVTTAPLYAALIKNAVKPVSSKLLAQKSRITNAQDGNATALKDSISSMGIYYSRKKIAQMIGHSKKVLLTFDDGPNPRTTPKILKIIKKRNIKAIFFVIGLQVKKYPNILKEIYADGHIIGNHTYHHKNLAKLSKSEIEAEIGDTNKLITSITGEKVKYLRPPYGAVNKNVINLIKREGMSVMLWNVDPEDWKNRNKYKTLYKLEKQLHIGSKHERGGVVLMHDIYSSTVSALGPFLDKLAENNYTITSIDKVSESTTNMWATCPPVLFHQNFKTIFNLSNSHNLLLSTLLKHKTKKKISTFALLKAQTTGNLIAFMFKANL